MKVIQFCSRVADATGDWLSVSVTAQVAPRQCLDWLDEIWEKDFAEVISIQDSDDNELVLNPEVESELLQEAINRYYQLWAFEMEAQEAKREDQLETIVEISNSFLHL